MLNDSYIKLGKIFLNSLHQNTDTSYLNKIIINNIGLNNENKNYLSQKFSKINFFESNVDINVKKVHDRGWLKALTMKTKTLRKIIENKDNLPIILIDSDMLVLKDFHRFIDSKYDIQICKLNNKGERQDLNPPLKLDYIACFVIINNNNKNTITFIDNWINEITNMYNKKLKPAYETPSLCKTILKYKTKIKIGDLDQDKIASDIKYIPNLSHIIHMRSKGSKGGKDHIDYRISNIKNYDKKHVLKYID